MVCIKGWARARTVEGRQALRGRQQLLSEAGYEEERTRCRKHIKSTAMRTTKPRNRSRHHRTFPSWKLLVPSMFKIHNAAQQTNKQRYLSFIRLKYTTQIAVR